MNKNRILCLDLGEARIGVAVSDPLGFTAQSVCVLKNDGSFLDRIRELMSEYDTAEIVIGRPLNQDGSEGRKALNIKEQSEYIASQTGAEVHLWDERFSTKEAQRLMEYENISQKKQKNVIDMLAAQIILQNYLDVQSIKNKQKNKSYKGVMIMEDKITLINEEGEEIEFIVDEKIDFEGKSYIILCEDEDSDDALLFRIEEDEDGEILLIEVKDDDEFDRVSDFYFEN